MVYSPQTWANGSGGGTPLSAARLAVMEQGIADAHGLVSSGLDGVFDITAYDAVGNDSADCTDEIAAALTAGAGAVVYVPEGVFRISSALTVPANTTLTGRGTIKQVTTGVRGLNLSSGSTVEGITIQGSRSSAVYNSAEFAIYAIGSSTSSRITDVTVRNVTIYGWGGHGIHCWYATRFRLEDNYIHDCGYAGIGVMSVEEGLIHGNRIDNIVPGIIGDSTEDMYGIYMSHYGGGSEATNPRTRRVTVSGNVVSRVPWEAIETHGGTDIAITGNVMYDNRDNVALVAGSYNLAPQNISVTGNVAFNTSTDAAQYQNRNNGVTIAGYTSTYRATGVTVSGNTFRNLRQGIYMIYTRGANISGNTFNEINGGGVCPDGWNDGFVVSGNTFTDLWHDSQTSLAPVVVSAYGYETGHITGNVLVRGTKTATYVNRYGVRVLGTPSNTALHLGQNDFSLAESGSRLYADDMTVFKAGGWHTADPVTRPTVSGDRSDGVALTNLLTALESLGLIDDTTTA